MSDFKPRFGSRCKLFQVPVQESVSLEDTESFSFGGLLLSPRKRSGGGQAEGTAAADDEATRTGVFCITMPNGLDADDSFLATRHPCVHLESCFTRLKNLPRLVRSTNSRYLVLPKPKPQRQTSRSLHEFKIPFYYDSADRSKQTPIDILIDIK